MAHPKKSAKAKRLETLAVETKRQKAEILEQLKKMPIVETACAKAGVGHSTYYAWRKADKEFSMEADRARAEGKSFINAMAESQLIRRIGEGHVTSIIYWLKNNHSDYTDTIRYVHEHEHNHHVELEKHDRDDIVRALLNIGLGNILKVNGDPRTAEEYNADSEAESQREEEARQKRFPFLKKDPGAPTKHATLGERLAEEDEEAETETE